jgi:hypothetical protein
MHESRLPLDAGLEQIVADVAQFLRPVGAASTGGNELAGRRPVGGERE